MTWALVEPVLFTVIVTRPSRELPEGCALLSLPDDPESDEPPAEASFPLEVGYQNRGTAWRAVHDSLNSRIAEAVTEYRELELARLDALQAAHWPQAVAGSVRSADLVLRVIDRRMKLLGLDRPRMEDDRPRYLVVSAPDDDEAGYIRQLQAITAMSDEPNQATRKATEPAPDEEQVLSTIDLRGP